MSGQREQREPIPTTFDLEDTKARKQAAKDVARAAEAAANAATVTAWRAVDPANRTCTDKIALELASWAAMFGREKA